jgi:uncharacterized RDD family membrane protein YckC/Tfp pilus assembly major pilin PilA
VSQVKTHYDNLQVKETASDEVIKGAYRYLSQKWHPDKNPHNKQEAERVLRIINQAYAVLSDPIKRKEHDDWIKKQRNSGDGAAQNAPSPSPHTQHQRREEYAKAPAHAQGQAAGVVMLYAEFWKRFAAMILDWLIMLMPAVLVVVVIGVMVGVSSEGSDKSSAEALGNLAGFPLYLLYWLYFAFMESSAKQATLGKMALGIKVVDLQGNRISFGRATGRFFGKNVSGFSLGIGYVMAAFTKRKQALHDMTANCLVVNEAVIPSDLQQTSPTTGMSTGAIIALVIVGSLFPITGILAAIALPVYQDYTVRARMAEVVHIGDQATKAVEEFIAQNNAIPTQIEQTGFSATSPYVKHVMVNGQNGVVLLITGFSPITDKALVFVPSLDQNKMIVWKCTSEDIRAKYLPQRCR